MVLKINIARKKMGTMLLNTLAVFSMAAHAQQPNRIEFDISQKNLPKPFNAIIAFIYEASDGITPGVVRLENNDGYYQWPFSIKTQSQFISATHAEVIFNGQLHEKYKIDASCSTIRVLDGRGTQFIYFNIDLDNKILSCLPTDN